MSADNQDIQQVEKLLGHPELAAALHNRQFRRFLDGIPFAIAISRLSPVEKIVYVNPRFEKLTGESREAVEGKSWDALNGTGEGENAELKLETAIAVRSEWVGTFRIEVDGKPDFLTEVYSSLIEDDEGQPAFRLAALVDMRGKAWRDDLEQRIRDKDLLLKELQHRVKNNLQIITALIRLESRSASSEASEGYERLAGRIEALALLYQLLARDGPSHDVDICVYLSQIASAVMAAHAVEGIRLELKVESFLLSINVAMPLGLAVNELMTNSLKHAFKGRPSGTILLRSAVDGDNCRIVVADDGVGLPEGEEWPRPGGLGVLIVETLRENANATITVDSNPGAGTMVTIIFAQRSRSLS
ncbi:MAG: sensor histidine kinase [Aestuariivirgaceae bacterium]